MGETILFCFVFLSQILLISVLYPRRIISRGRYVLQNFPPSTHPKGYPQPLEYYERRLRNIARVNFVIVVVGLAIIGLILGTLIGGWDAGIFTAARKNLWNDVIVAPYFILQIAVSVGYVNLSTLEHRKAMANAPPPRVRTTELHRRRLVDFASPALLIVAAATNVAFIAFVLYYRRFGFPWFTAAGNIAGVAFMLLALSVAVGITFRARKSDPYQANEDRHKIMKLVVQQGLGLCITVPVLVTVQLVIKLYDPTFLEPVIASLFVQGVAVAILWPSYRYRVDQHDFDVYRRDARDSTPDASARIGSP